MFAICDPPLQGTPSRSLPDGYWPTTGAQSSVGFVRHRRSALAYAGTASRCRTGQDQRSPEWSSPTATAACVDLQLSVLPKATHVLDWYHLTRPPDRVEQRRMQQAKPQNSCPHESTPGYRSGSTRSSGAFGTGPPPSRPSARLESLLKPARAAFFGGQGPWWLETHKLRRPSCFQILEEQRRIVTRLWPSVSSW